MRNFLVLTMLMSIIISCKTNAQFVLLTSLYNEKNSTRIAEYHECLEKNLHHMLIKSIHILYDTTKDNPRSKGKILSYLKKLELKNKIKLTYIKGRPSFEFMFTFLNRHYSNQKIIISNADIYFNQTLNKLTYFNLDKKFITLTRWNVQPNGAPLVLEIFSHTGKVNTSSQDVWIFKTPIINFANTNLKLGTWHFEDPLAYSAQTCGYTVINPYNEIQCCHLHLSRYK